MANPTTDVTRHDFLDPEAFPDFVIHDAREILHLIKCMIEKRTLLSAYLDRDVSFVSAVLELADDDANIILDASPEEELNVRATQASSLVCVARLDGVRLQFSVSPPERIVRAGLMALRTPLPASVLRLQRREFFRQTVPMGHPVACTIVLGDEAGASESVPIRVLDISNGGIAVLIPPEGIEFTAGKEFDRCVVSIPDKSPVTVKLRVRNVFTVSNRSGKTTMRAGCEFIDMPTRFMNQIQRYIYQIERDRRTLEPHG